MAKGIKKIIWTGEGKVFNGKVGSIPNQLLVVGPDEFIWFKIGEWYPETTDKDKTKEIKWAAQTPQGKIEIQKTLSSGNKFGFKIPKELCGTYTWYIEASWSGNFDGKSGLKIKGRTPTRIVSSRWTKVEGGKDVRQEYHFSYGELIWLRLYTEGLNGFNNVKVHIFRRLRSAFGLLPKDDEITRKIYSVDVIKGQINLKITNTYSWGESIKDKKNVEEFYVRVVHPIVRCQTKLDT